MHSALIDIETDFISGLGDNVPSYTDFARTIILPDGKSKNDALEPTPPQACILQALDQGYVFIVIVKPVQDGATTIALVPLFRRAVVEHQTVLLCYPTSDVGKDIWTSKVTPVLASFGGASVMKGGGSKGGAARLVTLPNGGRFMLRSGGGRGESGQSAVSGDAMKIDEVDDWPDRRTILNMFKRIKESASPFIVLASTVKLDHGSIILTFFDGGTRTHLEYPCPLCGVIQRMVWEQVDIEAARYRCAHCLELWTEAQRKTALTNWKRVDEAPQAKRFSILWTCLDSWMTTIHEEVWGTTSLPGYLSAVRFLEVGDHSEMRSFYRDRLARVYTDDEQTEEGEVTAMTAKALSDRSKLGWAQVIPDLHEGKLWSRYVADEQPPEAEGAVMSLDVQGDRVYWSLILFNYKGVTWDFAWGTERIRMRQMPDGSSEPVPWSPGDLALVMDRIRDLLPSLTLLPILHRVVDTQYEGAELAIWLRKNPAWRGLHGAKQLSSGLRVHVRDILAFDPAWLVGLGRWEVVTKTARGRVHDGYRKAITEAGAAILPRGLKSNDTYLKHMCSWVRDVNERTLVTDWIKKQKRDDFLDTRTYATALILKEVESRITPRRPPVQYGVVGKVG